MSTPTVNLDVLRTLHRIHKQLSDLKDRRERGPRQVHAFEAGVKLREDELAKIREEHKEARKHVDQKQLQIKTGEQKIKDHQTKLNMAATNKEYQIMKDQIAADKMANSVLEDETLEAMEQVETFPPRIKEAEGVLKTAQEKLAGAKADVAKQAAAILSDIERLEGELVQMEGQLPEEIQSNYQRMAKQRGEDALAEVVDGACGGCYQQIPINIQSNIRMSQVSFCKSCGRLLYFPEER